MFTKYNIVKVRNIIAFNFPPWDLKKKKNVHIITKLSTENCKNIIKEKEKKIILLIKLFKTYT